MVRKIIKITGLFSFWIIIQTGILFSSNASHGDIVITEFFFNSNGNIYQYIEIFNTTDSLINLENWKIEIDGSEYSINDTLKINSRNYIVLYSNSGTFNNSENTTYCSSFGFHPIFNNCDNSSEDLYWLKFPDLSDESGVIKVIDNTSIIIDEVIYDSADSEWSQIVGSANIGKAVEFILDPSSDAYTKNNFSSNWKSSHHVSEWQRDGEKYENGSSKLCAR